MPIIKVVKEYDENRTDKGLYSFINFASVGRLLKSKDDCNISYYCDGILMALFVSLFTFKRVARVSFDFTSIAHRVFGKAELENQLVYLVGATSKEIASFKNKLEIRFPKIQIVGLSDGYFKESSRDLVLRDIIDKKAEVVVVGLGAGLQEDFLVDLSKQGFNNTAYSCGGFIRQESNSSIDYYPKWIDKLHLRSLYRMYKEPHTIKRYLVDYPVNMILLAVGIVLKKNSFELR